MSKVVNWIFGGVLLFLGFDALLDWILPSNLLRAVLVFAVGIIIMKTDHGETSHRGGGYVQPQEGSSLQKVRGWFFGGFIALVGLVSLLLDFNKLPDFFEFLSFISLEELVGPWLIIAIGAIYLVAPTKYADIPMRAI